MSQFQPGDKVLHRREKDLRNYGEVMDTPEQQKPGWIAVYFQRKVWCKPENLQHLQDVVDRQQQRKQPQQSLKDYWMA